MKNRLAMFCVLLGFYAQAVVVEFSVRCYTTGGGTLSPTNCSTFNSGRTKSGTTDMYYFGKGQLVKTYLPEATRTGYEPDWFGIYRERMATGVFLVTNHVDDVMVCNAASAKVGDVDMSWSDCAFECRWLLVTNRIAYVLNGGTLPPAAPVTYTIEDEVILPSPTWTGHAFSMWRENGVSVTGISRGSLGDRTFVASWETNSYELVFEKGTGIDGIWYRLGENGDYTRWDGTQTINVLYDTKWYAYATPASGYTYTETSSTRPASGTMGTEGASFSAAAVAQSYKITLYPQGGTINAGNVTTYLYGQGASLPIDVTKRGHSFTGWFEDASCTGTPIAAITASDVGDKTYYAGWNVNTYQVTLHYNGAVPKEGQDVTNYVYGVGAVLPTSANMTYAGWVFDGWYDNADCLGNSVQRIGTDAVGNREFWANWPDETTYYVTFYDNWSEGYDMQNFTYFEKKNLYAVAELEFIRPGYAFSHWATMADGGGQTYTDGQKVSKLTAVNKGKFPLYAQWKTNEYLVVFDANGGAGEMPSQHFFYDEEKALTSNVFVKTGYAFAGWKTNDAAGTVFADGACVSNLTVEADGVVTQLAQWVAGDYAVTFDAGGGMGEMPPMTIKIDQATNLMACSFTRAGYGFAGWTNVNGAAFADRGTVSNLTMDVGGQVPLFATWTGVTYRVTLDAGDKGRACFADGEHIAHAWCTVGDVYPAFAVPTSAVVKSIFTGWSPATNLTVVLPTADMTNFVAQWTHPLDEIARIVDLPESAELYFTSESSGAGSLWQACGEDVRQGDSSLEMKVGLVYGNKVSVKTTLTGPGRLTFDYKASFANGGLPPTFHCLTNDCESPWFQITGTTDWCVSPALEIGAGESVRVEWIFWNGNATATESDYIRLDHFVWTPAGGKGPEPSAPVGVDGASPFGFSFGSTTALNVCVTNTSNGWNYRLWSTTDLRTPREAWTQETNVVPATMGERIEFALPLGAEPCKFFQFRID